MSMAAENGKRVFVGHLTSNQQWNRLKETAEKLGVVEHITRLFPSKRSGYYFGFIVMETHDLADQLVHCIGQEKYDEDYAYGLGPNGGIWPVKYPQTYADWAKVKEPNQAKPFFRRRFPRNPDASNH